MASTETTEQLLNQWKNRADILNLLLLIGGNVVQTAITQMVGYCACRYGHQEASGSSILSFLPPCIPITPVAFFFGWVALTGNLLLSSIGDKKLLPAPERSALLINCANSFQRDNKSWVLERLLRDHELAAPTDDETTSIRIDVFELGPLCKVKMDWVWWLGLITIVAQIAISVVPWTLYRDWGVMLIVLSGNLLVSMTCALPQWRDEKWSVRNFKKDNVFSLTRGNGHKHVMVFIGSPGSPDLDVSLGMIQNLHSAGAARNPSTAGLQINAFKRKETKIGKYSAFEDDTDNTVDLDAALASVAPLKKWMKDDTCDPENMPN
ncbi:unnamed protein product [Alternaria sp. RS040]